MLLNFSTVSVSDATTCNQLIEIVADHDHDTKTYRNRYKIPVVDKNGKMMFNVGVQSKGTSHNLTMMPVRGCRFAAYSQVTITYVDHSETVITSRQSQMSSHIEVSLDNKSLEKVMTNKILSIAFSGTKYDYDVVLKPNQGRVVQDIFNCIQH